MTQNAVKVEVENLSEVKRKLRIEVPSNEVTEEVDRAYRQLGKSAKVKGFRPGKVPRSILEIHLEPFEVAVKWPRRLFNKNTALCKVV